MNTTAARRRLSFFHTFSRSQVAAALATGVDFGLLFLLVEAFHVWYVVATALGAFAGAVTNFLVNRHWSFKAADGHWGGQAFRYILVSGISLILNTGGVYLLTEYLRIHYSFSVVIASMAVGVLFNYPLHRHYVFK